MASNLSLSEFKMSIAVFSKQSFIHLKWYFWNTQKNIKCYLCIIKYDYYSYYLYYYISYIYITFIIFITYIKYRL